MIEKDIKQLRKYLKTNIITNKTLNNYGNERKEVFDLVERTIKHGESNSALLIGPKSSGKTTLINNVLRELDKENHFKSNAVLVKLNGLIHTNDGLALKSICLQMNLETVLDGQVFGSFAENLSYVLACLKSGDKTAKSVVFVLDEFDLFCSHHNQTLIYNLFDISQSPQTPVCVIGVTCRLDVIELLEKRVKSRFSHRQIFLFPGTENDADSLDLALKRIGDFLVVPKGASGISVAFKKQWNGQIKALVEDKKFRELIQKLVDVDLSEKKLKNVLVSLVCRLSSENPGLTLEMFTQEIQDCQKDDIVRVLQDLSVLELCLIVAMRHHMEIYDQNTMNFEMIFTRFSKFSNSNTNIQSASRAVLMKALERIENLELICMLHSGNNIQKEFQLFKFLVLPHQITEAISRIPRLPTEVVQWASQAN